MFTDTVDGSFEILRSPAEVGSLSHYLQGFIHVRWLFGFPSINSISGSDLIFVRKNLSVNSELSDLKKPFCHRCFVEILNKAGAGSIQSIHTNIAHVYAQIFLQYSHTSIYFGVKSKYGRLQSFIDIIYIIYG